MHHGVGTNGRQMSMILGVPLAKAGFELVAIDMPNYGMTKNAHGSLVSYVDWANIADDFINFELEHDPRPIVLYGLSAGGMLAYHAAVLNNKVKGIVAMTFLDQSVQQIRDESCRNIFMSRSAPLLSLFSAIPFLASISIPMSLPAKMTALVNSPAAMKVFFSDKKSAGNWTTMRFLSTYLNYRPSVLPEEFTVCPILLTQPAEDKWTPLHHAKMFLDRMKKVPVIIVELENAGHYPLEQPGLDQMSEAIVAFLRRVESSQ
jgi:pimeloyl-ACP methyl ester carboxylesterase